MKFLIGSAEHDHYTYRLANGYQSIWYWPTPEDAYEAAQASQPDAHDCVILDGDGGVVSVQLNPPKD